MVRLLEVDCQCTTPMYCSYCSLVTPKVSFTGDDTVYIMILQNGIVLIQFLFGDSLIWVYTVSFGNAFRL